MVAPKDIQVMYRPIVQELLKEGYTCKKELVNGFLVFVVRNKLGERITLPISTYFSASKAWSDAYKIVQEKKKGTKNAPY